jgi:hypothetical protein
VVGELARMFGKWPHEVLELDPYELGLCVQVWAERDRLQNQALDTIAKQNLPVFPAVIVKGS